MVKRKFGALADFRQQLIEPESEVGQVTAETTMPEAQPALAAELPRGKGRPPGKRSNPHWKLYSHFLKKQTQRQAAARLAELDDGRDLSDVLQELLSGWLDGMPR
jgi:hypothetical protein